MSFLDQLNYTILPNTDEAHSAYLNLFNEVYGFWKQYWGETIKQMGGPALDQSQILRQDLISILTWQNKIVGTHFYSVFDWRLDLTKESDYFSQVASELDNYCISKKVNRILTQEYLCVSPEFRKSISQVSVPEVIISLALKIMDYMDCEATVGTVRAGAPSVDRICKQINATLMETNVFRYSQPHKFFIANNKEVQSLANPELNSLVIKLWEQKTDLSLVPKHIKVA